MTPDQERALKIGWNTPRTPHAIAAEILRAEARGIRMATAAVPWGDLPIAENIEAQANELEQAK